MLYLPVPLQLASGLADLDLAGGVDHGLGHMILIPVLVRHLLGQEVANLLIAVLRGGGSQ